MPRRSVLTNRITQRVRQRARFLCEYCHTSEQWQYVPFTVDHVLPVAKGGQTELENLALACFHCNRRKSDLVTAVDPQTNATVQLFHPQQDGWDQHFAWNEDSSELVGLTETGRATIEVLKINRPQLVRVRKMWVTLGEHPPGEIAS